VDSRPEEDAPAASGVESDNDTTAAEQRPPARSITASGEAAPVKTSGATEDDEEDERTVQQELDPEMAKLVRSAQRARAPMPPLVAPAPRPDGDRRSSSSMRAAPKPLPAAGMPPPAAPPPSSGAPPTALPATALPPTALPATAIPGSAMPATAPSAPPVSAAPDTAEEIDADDLEEIDPLEDSITATAPRARAAKLGLAVPGSVEIRTVEHDELLDETEVKTMAGPLEPPKARELRPEQDDGDDGPTTQTAAPSRAVAPNAATLVSPGAPPPSAPGPRAPRSRTPETPKTKSAPSTDREPDASTAPRPPLPSTGEIPTARRVTAGELPTKPGVSVKRETSPDALLEPPTQPGVAKGIDDYDPDAEESITARGLAMADPAAAGGGDGEDEESITQQQPPMAPKVLPAAGAPPRARFDAAAGDAGDSGDTTQKRKHDSAAPATLPADEEAESITTQAPGHLTNMLRVIASGTGPEGTPAIEAPDEDDLPQNKTAVMIGAPVKPDGALHFPPPRALDARAPAGTPSPLGGVLALAGARLEPSSDSGLRVARPATGSVDRVSVGVLAAQDAGPGGVDTGLAPLLPSDMLPVAARHDSGKRQAAMLGHAATEPAFPPLAVPPVDPRSGGAPGSAPRYGLLVGVVAVVSLLVPTALYFALRSGSPPVGAMSVPAVTAPDLVRRVEAPRAKATRRAVVVAPSAPPSASSAPPQRPSWLRR
jgi:hypothetical protein